jgi:tRNA-dihydrouridine synthase C
LRCDGLADVGWSAGLLRELLPLMQVFFDQVRATVAARHQGGRLKQWLHYLKRAYPEAEAAYAELRTVNAADELAARLFR